MSGEISDETKEFISKILDVYEKKMAQLNSDVVNPELEWFDSHIEGGLPWFRYPFEKANAKHLVLIDKMLMMTCLDLSKKGVEAPMEVIALACSKRCKSMLGPDANIAMHLLTVRASNNAHWMREFRRKGFFFELSKIELRERGLLKKR